MDPDGFNFTVYQGILNESPVVIEFGTGIGGSHDIIINIESDYTLNLRVRVWQVRSVLESLGFEEIPFSFQIFRYSPIEPFREHSFSLEKNVTAEFSISATTPLILGGLLNISLIDPESNYFIIFQNYVFNNNQLSFEFETTHQGTHKIEIGIIIEDTCLNLALVITYESQDIPHNNDNPSTLNYWIPLESQFFSAAIVFLLFLLPYMMIKKSSKNQN
jgi:hypothetical protein